MKFAFAILAAFVLLPTAGSASGAGLADPADLGSAVPPFKYESVFLRYLPHQDDAEVSDWRNTSFNTQTPRNGETGQMRMQHAPAQPQSPNDGGGSSGHGMHHMHKM